MKEIDEIVALINNGQWHPLEEIINKSKLQKAKANKILQFLTDFNFITVDSKKKKARTTRSLLKFLNENQTC